MMRATLKLNKYSAEDIAFSVFLFGWLSYPYLVLNVGDFSISGLHIFMLMILFVVKRVDKLVILVSTGILSSFLFTSLVGAFYFGSLEKFVTHGLQTSFCILTIIFFSQYNFNAPVAQKLINVTIAIVFVYLLYQLIGRFIGWNYTFLKVNNLQISLSENTEGFQRGYHLLGSRILELRPNSFFIEPGSLGYFGAGMAFLSRNILMKIVASLIVLLSMSMGAYLIFFVSMAVKLLLEKRFLTILFIISIGIVSAVLLHYFSDMFRVNITERFYRVFFEKGFGVEKRLRDIDAFFDFFNSSPVIGYGLYGEKVVLKDSALSMVYQSLLIERGLIGTALHFMPMFIATLANRRTTVLVFASFYFISLFWKPYKFFIPSYLFIGYVLNKRVSNGLNGERRQ